jgi:hypothetical protein
MNTFVNVVTQQLSIETGKMVIENIVRLNAQQLTLLQKKNVKTQKQTKITNG